MQQRPREREPLLLATAQSITPVLDLVKLTDERLEPCILQRRDNRLLVECPKRRRIADRLAQAGDRQIRALRKEQHPSMLWHFDLPLAKRPDPSHRAKQGALANTRRSTDEQSIVWPNGEIGVAQDELPIRQCQVEVFGADRVETVGYDFDPLGPFGQERTHR